MDVLLNRLKKHDLTIRYIQGGRVLKILHLIDNLTFGGAQRLLIDILPSMQELGVESDLLTLKKTGSPFEKELQQKGVNIYNTGLRSEYSPRQVLRIAAFTKERNNQYDLVHSHLFPAQYWLVLSGLFRKADFPLLTTEHNTHNSRRGKPYFKFIEKYVYQKYDRIICISEPAKTNLLKWLPELENKTLVIPNGVDIKRFSTAQSYPAINVAKGIKDTDKIILMVASMTRQKDHATVIRAANLLPESYHFCFAGDGPQKADLTDQAAASGLSGRIHFLGLRNDVERLIKTADLFVLSSQWEGFGLVAVEAMAGGIPVIASDVPGLAEVVKGAGLLFEPANEKQLAESIEQSLSSSQFYQQLVEKGFMRAERYSLDQTVREYFRLYESVIQ